MHDDARKLIWDGQQAAERIARFVAMKTFAHYRSDELLRSAVERQLAIVGEALGRLRQTDASVAASIPELAKIVACRNILIHGYASVDDRIVWGIVELHLERLRGELSRLLTAS